MIEFLIKTYFFLQVLNCNEDMSLIAFRHLGKFLLVSDFLYVFLLRSGDSYVSAFVFYFCMQLHFSTSIGRISGLPWHLSPTWYRIDHKRLFCSNLIAIHWLPQFQTHKIHVHGAEFVYFSCDCKTNFSTNSIKYCCPNHTARKANILFSGILLSRVISVWINILNKISLTS
jgi:hypothetical protein